MTRKRHIENVNPREEYIKLLNSNRSPDKRLNSNIEKNLLIGTWVTTR